MKVLGFEITRTKAAPQNLTSVNYGTNWWRSFWGPIMEPYMGAWQQNVTVDNNNNLLAFSAVFACVTGIASDIAKMRIKLSRNDGGIWKEITENQPWLPVLRKPNHYQTRLKFIEHWIVSKLLFGNAYILKNRDKRGVVNELYVLDPCRVIPLVAPSGDVYYELKRDDLAGIPDPKFQDRIVVPASDIIHDTMVCLWHPLIGVSPLYACALSGTMGNRIQTNSTVFFNNLSRPGGMLTAPGAISDETALRLKTTFETNFGGANVGRLFVAGDGLQFQGYSMPAEQAQLIDQLKWTVEDVGRAFHYPAFKLGGPLPPYAGNTEALIITYYTDCLQSHIESLELCLDEGLGLPLGMGTEFDLDNLMRMDTAALYESNNKGVEGGWMKVDEARFRANLEKVKGGDSPYLQQQNYSLEALAKRDAKADPFATTPPPQPKPPNDEPKPPEEPPTPAPADSLTDEERGALAEFLTVNMGRKEWSLANAG